MTIARKQGPGPAGFRLRRCLAGVLVCVLFAGACSKAGDQSSATGIANGAKATRGTLRIAIRRSPNTLNPLFATTTTEGMLNRLSFDTLVSVDAAGNGTVPILATEVPTTRNGGISKDGVTITYHLRSGVKWQDGVAFTSKDVKFTWRAIVNAANNVATHAGYEDVRSVDTPNATTVIFHLKHKFAPFVNTVFGESDSPIGILPEHLLSHYNDLNHVGFNEAPIGTGPFKVTRWMRGDRVELEANDTYFRGKPKLRRIVVREIPDENTSLNALRSHDVDWIFEASPILYNTLKTIPGVRLALNDVPESTAVLVNTTRPGLADVRVRMRLTNKRSSTRIPAGLPPLHGRTSRASSGRTPTGF